jgi:predicted peroxiredoxin
MLKRKSPVLALLFAAAVLASGWQQNTREDKTPPPRDGVFIHISKGGEDPQAVLMALQMAGALSADHDALVYLDMRGINVVLKDAPDLTFSGFESSQTQLKALVNKKIPIYACPGCLKAAGKTPDDLIPDIKVPEKETFFNFTKGRILTLDY